jgi:triosephosphate isomerase
MNNSHPKRRRIMAANWKMYKTAQQTAEFLTQFRPLLDNLHHGRDGACEVVLFPPALSIPAAVSGAAGSRIKIGGQNIYWEREGAFTGEISAPMLAAAGAAYALVGHSERRQYFCESDAQVLKKAQAALSAGLKPLICVGERLEEHKGGQTREVLIRQFAGGIAGLTEEEFTQIAIAYEPVWAIGTGQTATPQIAADAHRMIRAEAGKRYGDSAAEQLPILYGGSVKPDNIVGLMAEPAIDGVLVGGASLDPQSFAKIVAAA